MVNPIKAALAAMEANALMSMNALPEPLPTPGKSVFTGLVCPECSGNLVIRAEQRLITFACRVGHLYGLSELLAAKEGQLETALWRAVFAFEELTALLSDLNRKGLTERFGAEGFRARADLAREQSIRLRALIESDRPLVEKPRRAGGAP